MGKCRLFHFIILAFSLSFAIGAYAQHGEAEVYGKVTDSKGRAVGGVAVYVLSGGNQYAGTTDVKGEYAVRFERADTVTLALRCLGFDPQQVRVAVGDTRRISRNLTLHDSSTELEGITVESARYLAEGSKTIYLPTRKQVGGAHDASQLLFNLMIPQIKVSPMGGNIEATDGGSIAILIDGRDANASEVAQLRAKDVARVEYDDHPTGKYARYTRMLNIIKKEYDHGGYVDATLMQQTGLPASKAQLQASVDRKGFNLMAMYGMSYERDDHSGTTSTYHYQLTPDFDKSTRILEDKCVKAYHTGLLRAQWKRKNLFTTVQAGLSFSTTPKDYSVQQVDYLPAVYPSSLSREDTYSRDLSPYVSVFQQWDLGGKRWLNWSLSYHYLHNDYRRQYAEGSLPCVSTMTDENFHEATMTASYVQQFGGRSSLSVSLSQIFQKSQADYLTSAQQRQDLDVYDMQFNPIYTYRIGRSFSLVFKMGINLNTYRANAEDRVTKMWFRPGFIVNYGIDKTSNIQLSAGRSSTAAQMADMTAAVQQVSAYEYVKGNSQLKTCATYKADLSYNKHFKPLSLSAYTKFFGYYHRPSDFYYAEDGALYREQRNNGDIYRYTTGVSVSATLFHNLQLKASCGYEYTKITGYARADKGGFTGDVSLYYPIGKFFTQIQYLTPSASLLYSPQGYYKKESSNLFVVGFKTGDWSFRAGGFDIFKKHSVRSKWYDYGVYSFRNDNTGRDVNQRLFLVVSYSPDFGRKVKREKVTGQDAKSAILKP